MLNVTQVLVSASGGDTEQRLQYRTTATITELKWCNTQILVSITTQWRESNQIQSGGCEPGRASMCESRERERGKREMFDISSFGGRSVVIFGLGLASRQAWQEGSVPQCTAVCIFLFDAMLSLSHSLFASPGFWCCFLLLEKQRQQPCLWVEIISFRWKPCAVSVCDFHAFISLEGSHAALQVEAILQPSSSKLCQNRVNETSWNEQLIRLLQFRPGWWTQRIFHVRRTCGLLFCSSSSKTISSVFPSPDAEPFPCFSVEQLSQSWKPLSVTLNPDEMLCTCVSSFSHTDVFKLTQTWN